MYLVACDMNMGGMLHTVHLSMDNPRQDRFGLVDMSAQLTRKLQKMVRQGAIFKLVGIDGNLRVNLDDVTTFPQSSYAGLFFYISPTKGRCDAWRHAFKSVQKWRSLQGVAPNYNYDFRVGLDAKQEIEFTLQFGDSPISNQAWLERTEDVANSEQGLFLKNSYAADSYQSIFDVWNMGIEMNDGGSDPTFGQGWTPYIEDPTGTRNVPMDFVKNEQADLVTNPRGPSYASLEWDTIPWQLSFSKFDDTAGLMQPANVSATYQWRPVANEYVPVMCGLMMCGITAVSEGGATDSDGKLDFTFHIKGWNPIIKRRRKSRRRGKK